MKNKLKEYWALILLMQTTGKLRIGFLALDMFTILLVVGGVFNYITPLYVLSIIFVVLLYIIGLLLWTFNE